MDVAHILLRVKSDGSNEKEVKMKADTLYQQIKRGVLFEEAARRQSEDKSTGERGGFIGAMTINQFERQFEEAAYALAKDGDISTPVRTRLGWHIIKRVKKRPMQTYDASKKKGLKHNWDVMTGLLSRVRRWSTGLKKMRDIQ